MKVILLEGIKGLGKLGDSVVVKAGYGRNYLLPAGKAIAATKEKIKYFEERREELEQAEKERIFSSNSMAEKLSKLQKKDLRRLNLLRWIPLEKGIHDKESMQYDLSHTFNLLGNAQYKLGLMNDALISYYESIRLLENQQANKTNKEYKFRSLEGLGRVELYSGNFVKSEKIYKQLLKETKGFYINHPTRQAPNFSNLGFLMYHIGEFKKAKDLVQKSEKIKMDYLSPKHTFNSETNLKLGLTNYMLGNLKAAEENFMFVQELCKLHDNNILYEVISNLGLWQLYETSGKYEKAITHLEKAINVAKLQYENNNNLNSMMSYQLTQAETWHTLSENINTEYLKKSLKSINDLFGENNYQSAKYHYMLGQSLERENKLKDAHEHYKVSLEILTMQKIGHPNLQQFYDGNTNNLKNALLRISIPH